MLTEEDRRKVEAIRPGGPNSRDTYCWDYTTSGAYTVKSGYWVAQNLKEKEELTEVNQPSIDVLFQALWKLNTSPKVQHFLWRVLNDCLPVGGTMKYRHLAKDGICPRFQSKEETVNHVLFRCPYARLIWALSPIPVPPGGEWSDSLFENFYRILRFSNNHQEEESVRFMGPWLMWRLWKSRNAFIFRGDDYGGPRMIVMAQADMEEWKRRNELEEELRDRAPATRTVEKWQPPLQTWLKCNSDGAWDQTKEYSGVGWILRDHWGNVVWMGARRYLKMRNPIEAEAEALRWAVMIMVSLNYTNIVVKTDSKGLVQALRDKTNNPSLQVYLQDIHYLLTKIGPHQVIFRGRESNGVADRIAKEAVSLSNPNPILYSIMPMWIKPFVEVDKTSV